MDDDTSTSTSSTASATAAAAPVIVPGLHGRVSAFDANQEEWIEYVERLELYFLANDITDPAKKSDSTKRRRSNNLSTG